MNRKKLLLELTAEEKAALVSGTDFMYTNPIPRLGVPALCMADGPHGLRKQSGKRDNGVARSERATAFPTAAALACSWDPENARRMGAAIGAECRQYGIHVLLGPGVNIKRNPLCGRNFEYFSEDPLLAGKMGAAQVEGLQSAGVGACVKHFALNNSENYRFMGDSIADLRAIREIYLRPFERIVRQARPAAIMCAYNQINGVFCAENRWLLTEVLREEWGVSGIVMTDWGGIRDRILGLEAGLDLEMPGDTAVCRRRILDAAAGGSLEVLDRAAENVLRLVDAYVTEEDAPQADFAAHHALAAEIAADSAVLLENDGVLPLDVEGKFLVVGDLFKRMRYQGAGSSMIAPTATTTPQDAFIRLGVAFEFCRGYREDRAAPDAVLIAQAVKRAAAYERVLVFAGLTDDLEIEGGDRVHMRLPENQLALIDALCRSGKRPVVVLFGGSVVELPFAGQVGAILHMFLPGQNGGTAAAQLLFGERSPSGRLAESWPVCYEDVPFGRMYGRLSQELYQESIYVGYRYYLTAGKPLRYPFGYGLSYTTFAYSQMEAVLEGETVTASCEVANTGSRAASEVVQLYAKAPESCVFKPERELRGFRKIWLEPGECKRVYIHVPLEDLRCFHSGEGRWLLEGGRYEFQFCTDCQSVRLSQSLELVGETAVPLEGGGAYCGADAAKMTDAAFEALCGRSIPAPPPRYPVTTESRFTDLRRGVLGRAVTSVAVGVTELQRRLAQGLPEGPERDNRLKGTRFLRRILESSSLRSLSMSAGGAMPWNLAQGAAEFINGHPLRGLGHILRPIQVPPLPKRLKGRKKGGGPSKGAGTQREFFICGLQAEVDKAATRDWYAKAERWDCDCGHCRNFLTLALERALPAPVLEILDGLGVPPEKATYVCEMYPDAGGHCYSLGFRIAGCVPSGQTSAVWDWGEVRCLREMQPCSAPGFPEPHFDLEFCLTLPWVLDEPD